MSIDLNTKEGRNSFLKNNLNDLLEGVNDTYGPIIYEQLLLRINHTIYEFNEEINKAFSLLKQKDKERLDAYNMYKANNNPDDVVKNEWEEKLDKMENIKK